MAYAPSCLADLWGLPEFSMYDVVTESTGDGLAQVDQSTLDLINAAAEECRAQGVNVQFLDGWESRGRPSHFEPAGSVDHHTGGPAFSGEPTWWSLLYLVRDGRSDLNGPLANVCTWPDGTLWIVAAGTCNHAGPGEWLGLAGNYSVFGNELVHSGGPNEPWPEAQLRSALLWDVALCRLGGWSPDFVCEHKEWSNAGKIDRINIDGDEWRARVSEQLAAEPTKPEPTPEDELTSEEHDALIFCGQFLQEIKNVITEGGDGDQGEGQRRLVAALKASATRSEA